MQSYCLGLGDGEGLFSGSDNRNNSVLFLKKKSGDSLAYYALEC